MNIDLKIVLDIIGTFLTAFSIFWGVHVFKKTNDAKNIAILRTSLTDAQRILSSYQFDRLLSDESFSEMGVSASNQVRVLFDSPNSSYTSDSVLKFLQDSEVANSNEYNFFFTAISLGLYNSSAKKEARDVIETLSGISLRFEYQVPLISEILNGLLVYIIYSIEYATCAQEYFKVKDEFEEIKKQLDNKKATNNKEGDIELKDFIFCYLSEAFRKKSVKYKADYSKRVIDASTGILDVLAEVIQKKTDREILKLCAKAKKLYSLKIPDQMPQEPIDKTFFYIELLKDEFDTHQWDNIVAAKNVIRQTWHGLEYGKL